MMHNIPQVWKTYRDFPEEDRKTLIKMWMLFAKNYTNSFIEHKVYSPDDDVQDDKEDNIRENKKEKTAPESQTLDGKEE